MTGIEEKRLSAVLEDIILSQKNTSTRNNDDDDDASHNTHINNFVAASSAISTLDDDLKENTTGIDTDVCSGNQSDDLNSCQGGSAPQKDRNHAASAALEDYLENTNKVPDVVDVSVATGLAASNDILNKTSSSQSLQNKFLSLENELEEQGHVKPSNNSCLKKTQLSPTKVTASTTPDSDKDILDCSKGTTPLDAAKKQKNAASPTLEVTKKNVKKISSTPSKGEKKETETSPIKKTSITAKRKASNRNIKKSVGSVRRSKRKKTKYVCKVLDKVSKVQHRDHSRQFQPKSNSPQQHHVAALPYVPNGSSMPFQDGQMHPLFLDNAPRGLGSHQHPMDTNIPPFLPSPPYLASAENVPPAEAAEATAAHEEYMKQIIMANTNYQNALLRAATSENKKHVKNKRRMKPQIVQGRNRKKGTAAITDKRTKRKREGQKNQQDRDKDHGFAIPPYSSNMYPRHVTITCTIYHKGTMGMQLAKWNNPNLASSDTVDEDDDEGGVISATGKKKKKLKQRKKKKTAASEGKRSSQQQQSEHSLCTASEVSPDGQAYESGIRVGDTFCRDAWGLQRSTFDEVVSLVTNPVRPLQLFVRRALLSGPSNLHMHHQQPQTNMSLPTPTPNNSEQTAPLSLTSPTTTTQPKAMERQKKKAFACALPPQSNNARGWFAPLGEMPFKRIYYIVILKQERHVILAAFRHQFPEYDNSVERMLIYQEYVRFMYLKMNFTFLERMKRMRQRADIRKRMRVAQKIRRTKLGLSDVNDGNNNDNDILHNCTDNEGENQDVANDKDMENAFNNGNNNNNDSLNDENILHDENEKDNTSNAPEQEESNIDVGVDNDDPSAAQDVKELFNDLELFDDLEISALRNCKRDLNRLTPSLRVYQMWSSHVSCTIEYLTFCKRHYDLSLHEHHDDLLEYEPLTKKKKTKRNKKDITTACYGDDDSDDDGNDDKNETYTEEDERDTTVHPTINDTASKPRQRGEEPPIEKYFVHFDPNMVVERGNDYEILFDMYEKRFGHPAYGYIWPPCKDENDANNERNLLLTREENIQRATDMIPVANEMTDDPMNLDEQVFLSKTGYGYNTEIWLEKFKLLRDHFNNFDTSAVASSSSKEGVVGEDNRQDDDSGNITDNDDGNINNTLSNTDLAQEKMIALRQTNRELHTWAQTQRHLCYYLRNPNQRRRGTSRVSKNLMIVDFERNKVTDKQYNNISAKASALKSFGFTFAPENTIPVILWEDMYLQLVQYYEKHGHSNVANIRDKVKREDPEVKEHNRLANWVNSQRTVHKEYCLGKAIHSRGFANFTQEKIDMLTKVNFKWSTTLVDAWQKKFDALMKYKEENGDCLVPQKYPENPTLSFWVKRQREHYRLLHQGKSSSISAERITQLEEAGFVWKTRTRRPNQQKKSLDALASYADTLVTTDNDLQMDPSNNDNTSYENEYDDGENILEKHDDFSRNDHGDETGGRAEDVLPEEYYEFVEQKQHYYQQQEGSL